MIKSLKEARIIDALPRIVAGQDWVIALSRALGVQHENELRLADNSQIYTALDTASEEILDAMAICWKVDWYDTDYSLEQKRRIIKTAISVRRLMGTPYAVRTQADAVIPGTQLEEWFEYDGEPGTFRLYIDLTDSSEASPMDDYDVSELERRLTTAKRLSAQLESFSYMIRHAIVVGHDVKGYVYSAPECGMYLTGTYWTRATLGWSEGQQLETSAEVDLYAYEVALTGTLPETATKGYSTCGTVECGAAVETNVSTLLESGLYYSGSLG